jgi:ribosomal protein S18 acetylase RimI-like enzyme
MTARLLKKQELSLVRAIAHETWPHTFAEILSPEQISYMLDWMYNLETLGQQIDNGHLFYIVEKDRKAIGFLGIQPNFPETGKLKIHKLYVLPKAQGLGAGKLLIDIAINQAIDLKQEVVTLNVNKYNKAVEFYSHCGFKIAYDEVIDIGNGFIMDDYVMKLNVE